MFRFPALFPCFFPRSESSVQELHSAGLMVGQGFFGKGDVPPAGTSLLIPEHRTARGSQDGFACSVSSWRLGQKKPPLHLQGNLNQQPALARMTMSGNNAGEELKTAFQRQSPVLQS